VLTSGGGRQEQKIVDIRSSETSGRVLTSGARRQEQKSVDILELGRSRASGEIILKNE